MQELTDKVAVVTGAGGGIGRALVERFAAQGMRIAAADIDAEALAETARLVGANSTTTEMLTRVTDATDADDMGAFADAVFVRFAAVDVLCNNAGVFAGGLLWERPLADFE